MFSVHFLTRKMGLFRENPRVGLTDFLDFFFDKIKSQKRCEEKLNTA